MQRIVVRACTDFLANAHGITRHVGNAKYVTRLQLGTKRVACAIRPTTCEHKFREPVEITISNEYLDW